MIKFNKRMSKKQFHKINGFTLVEVIVGTAIFLLLALSVYQAYLVTTKVIRASRQKVTATALANEQFEIMRNLPYADVGIVGGLPSGKIPYIQNLLRDGKEFTVKTTIRNIDDPFDGTIGGEPNDTSPADYKLAEIEITCENCQNFPKMTLNTYIAPKALESAFTNGALFVKVFDAVGEPVSGANVYIKNIQTSPTFEINDITNKDGLLQIVDAPPSAESYEITVTKNGYTSDRTYLTGDPANPTPLKPHATVALQQLTQISFNIDKTSTLNISSVDNTCVAMPEANFSLKGLKIIGSSPEVLKYNENLETDNSGELNSTDLEWDTYNLTFSDDLYNLAGVIPATTFTLSPGSEQNLKLILSPKATTSLLITVKDQATGLPLSDANITLTGTEYNNTLITGRGFLRQTDWSEGAGQINYSNPAKYFDSDENIKISDPTGIIQLKKTLDEYSPNGWLISSTFDTGSPSNFHKIWWEPASQPVETGENSVRLQIATNNDKESWNFIGPDGTANTYYTIGNQEINPGHMGDRYLRYKLFLQTADLSKTPSIADIFFTFTSDCVPPGQVFFSDLLNNSYNLNITKTGYESYVGTVNTNNPWQHEEIILNP